MRGPIPPFTKQLSPGLGSIWQAMLAARPRVLGITGALIDPRGPGVLLHGPESEKL